MKIACVYTVETYYSIDQPLIAATEIPFGISMILTVLQGKGHDVELFVVTPDTPLDSYIGNYVREQSPRMVCFTAVSTQYWQAKKVAEFVRNLDKSIFLTLGGHHASLNTDEVAKENIFDAICVGEGEHAIIQLANQLDNHHDWPTSISNLWIRDQAREQLTKNETGKLVEDLDSLPLINRKIWDKWIAAPEDYPALLLGRGCPFKCTYCANHAMARLADGKYVRFRSPENIVDEIRSIRQHYPTTKRIYLEVETFGANRKASYAIFDALADYNKTLRQPIRFGVNLALTSNFMQNNERIHETLSKARAANIRSINIGLESGSERMRKEVLIRPKYTNDELVEFCKVAGRYGIDIIFFVLMGLPKETIEDYMETVRVARRANPKTCYVSIFYPYLGTDLASYSIHTGLIEQQSLVSHGERTHSVLNLPGFGRRRIRFEYIVFWWRVYRGHWPLGKVMANMFRSFLRAHPKAHTVFVSLRDNNSAVRWLAEKYGNRHYLGKISAAKTVGTRIDVISD
jgi:radical SAM superfamily enzyme YgiQ (UPF0313 family)